MAKTSRTSIIEIDDRLKRDCTFRRIYRSRESTFPGAACELIVSGDGSADRIVAEDALDAPALLVDCSVML